MCVGVGWSSRPAGEEAAGDPALPDGRGCRLPGAAERDPGVSAGIAASARPVCGVREVRWPCPRSEHSSVSCSLTKKPERRSSVFRHNLDTDAVPAYLSHDALSQSGPVSESHRVFPCPVIFLGEKADYLIRGSSLHSPWCVQLRACGEGRSGMSRVMAPQPLRGGSVGGSLGRGAWGALEPWAALQMSWENSSSFHVGRAGRNPRGRRRGQQSGRTLRFLSD